MCEAAGPDGGNAGPQNRSFPGKGRAGKKAQGVGMAPDRVSGNPKTSCVRTATQFPGVHTAMGTKTGVQRWVVVGSYKALYLGHLVSWSLPVASDPEICPSTLPSPSFLQGPSGGCLLLSPRWSHWAVCARIHSVPQDREHWQGRPLCFPRVSSIQRQGQAPSP